MTTIETTPTAQGGASAPAQQTNPQRRQRRKVAPDKVGLYGLLVTAALIALMPLLWMLSGSLQTLPELLANESFVPSSPQSQNYVTAWTQGELGMYLRNSVIYTGVAVVGILLVSSLAGYALACFDFPGKGVFTFVILAVMIIAAPAIFLAQFNLLISLGLTNSPVGYGLVLITSGLPMSILIMRSFFVSQPKELEEAGSIDGAGPLRTFWSIILPLARPGMAAVAVIQGLYAWNEYRMALVIFDDNNLMPIQRGLTAFTSAETPQQQILLAATAISVVPVVLFYLMAQRHIVKGISAGAVK